jgi:Matrixin
MRRVSFVLGVCAAVVLTVCGPASAGRSSSLPCNLPTLQNLPGAPTVSLPEIASSTREATLTGEACELRRADGSLLARVLSEFGRRHRAEFYNDHGRILFHVNEDYSTPPGTFFGSKSRARPRAAAGAWCGNDVRAPEAYEWRFAINWYLNWNSIPADVDHALTEQAVRNAGTEWEINDSHCTWVGDSSSIDYAYQGHTTASVGRNGINSVGWGRVEDFGYGSSILGIELTWYNDSMGWPDESDIRMDSDHLWQNGNTRPDRWDVHHVAAHERGHTSQFAHVSDSSNVMEHYLGPVTNWSNRKLGLGDANANNAKY